MNLLIEEYAGTPAEQLPFEVVERKGIGHPDSLADAIAEKASQYYSQYFLKKYNKLAHHWFDKVMLLGGESIIKYGHGEIIRPFKVIFAGKAVTAVGNDEVPMEDIFYKAASDVLENTLTGFKSSEHLEIAIEISSYRGPGQMKTRYTPDSEGDLFDLKNDVRLSNDCNVCTGFAPYSQLESSVLNLECYLSSSLYKRDNPDTGFDIKIVATRKKSQYEFFVNIPFLAKHILSHEQYVNRVKEVQLDISKFLQKEISGEVFVEINPEKYNGRPYLTVTGTVADTGDIGVVGRGNRINGLITPMRFMSIEASAGKNPIDHTGKLHSIFSHRLADKIAQKINTDVQVIVSTWKEKPVDDPQDVIVQIRGWEDRQDTNEIEKIVREELNKIQSISHELISDGIVLW